MNLSQPHPQPPLVSVSVISYQHGGFINKCLDSILAQETSFPFEVVIGEDASTDGTREICQSYAEKHPDIIRLFLHNRENVIYINGKPTGRYNILNNLKSCRGKYIAWCDGDDYWLDPHKLQKQVDFLESNPDYVLSFHRAQLIDAGGEPYDPKQFVPVNPRDLDQDGLVAGKLWTPTMTVMFRREHMTLPEPLNFVVNFDSFLFSILGQHGKAKFQPEIKDAMYRQHQGGVWSDRQSVDKILARIHTYQHLVQEVSSEFKDSCLKMMINMHQELLVERVRSRQPKLYFQSLFNFYRFLRTERLPVAKQIKRHAKLVRKLYRKSPAPKQP